MYCITQLRDGSRRLTIGILALGLLSGRGAAAAACQTHGAPRLKPQTAAEWDAVAIERGSMGDTDAEMRAWLEALRLEDSERRRRELGRLAAPRERILMTLDHDSRGPLSHVAMDPRGSTLATAGEQLRVWDLASGRMLWEAPGEVSPSYSADGRRLASTDSQVDRIRDSRSGALLAEVERPVSGGAHAQVRIDPLGNTVYSAANPFEQGRQWLWDSRSAKLLTPPLKGALRHITFSPDGQWLAGLQSTEDPDSWWEDLILWSRETGMRNLGPSFGPPAFDPTSQRLAAFRMGGIRQLDLATRAWSKQRIPAIGFETKHLLYPNQNQLAYAGFGQGWSWDLPSGRPLSSVTCEIPNPPYIKATDYTSEPLSPDGSRFAQGDHSDLLRIWSMATGRFVAPPLRHGSRVDFALFGSDPQFVLTASESGRVRTWWVPDRDHPQQTPHASPVSASVLEGELVARVTDHSLALLDLHSGQPLRLPGARRGSALLTCDAQGQRLAVRSESGAVAIFDGEGQQLAGPFQHPGACGAYLAGDRLVTKSMEQARRWDLSTGQALGAEAIWDGAYAWGPGTLEASLSKAGLRLRSLIDGSVRDLPMPLGEPEMVGPLGQRALVEDHPRWLLVELPSGEVLGQRPWEPIEAQFTTDGLGLFLIDDREVILWRPQAPDRRFTLPAGAYGLTGTCTQPLCLGDDVVYRLTEDGRWQGRAVPFGEDSNASIHGSGRWLAWTDSNESTWSFALPFVETIRPGEPRPSPAGSQARAPGPHAPYRSCFPAALSSSGDIAWQDSRDSLRLRPLGQAGPGERLSTPSSIRDLTWSRDGELVWLEGTGRIRFGERRLMAHDKPQRIAVHPGGQQLALAKGARLSLAPLPPSDQSSAVATNLEVSLGKAKITALAYSQDGRELAVATADARVHWFTTETLELARPSRQEDELIRELLHLGAGDWLAGSDRGAQVLGQPLQFWPTASSIKALARTGEGWRALCESGQLHTWSDDDKSMESSHLDPQSARPPARITITDPDLDLRATAFEDGSVCVANLTDGRSLGPAVQAQVPVTGLSFAAKGRRLVIQSPGAVSIRQIPSGLREGPIRQGSCVGSGPDRLFVERSPGRLSVLRLDDGVELWSRALPPTASVQLQAGAEPGPAQLLISDLDRVHLVRLESGRVRQIGTRSVPAQEQACPTRLLSGERALVGVDWRQRPPRPIVVDFRMPSADPLEGDPQQLIRSWEPRLGWTVRKRQLERR